MYLFECEATLQAEPAAVWAVWTDVARWPEWDVSKEIARLDGPFQPGVSGWAKQRGYLGGSFTITAVEAGRCWVTECPMPYRKKKVALITSSNPSPGKNVSGWCKRVWVGRAASRPWSGCSPPRCSRDIAESLAALGTTGRPPRHPAARQAVG